MDRKFELSRARVAAILNRRAGTGNGDGALLQERLAPACGAFTLIRPHRGQGLTALAAQAAREHDLIVAVGGDGTQAAVAQALCDGGGNAVMGVIPGGTFNYFARDLGVGETAAQAIDTLLDGRVARVSVGDMNGRIFLNNISLGAYPEILERRESFYRRWGRRRFLAYWAVLRTLMDLRHPLRLTARLGDETRVFHTALAFVAQSETQLDSFGLTGAEEVRRDRLPLFVARATGAWPLVGAALRLALGRTAHGEDFDLIVSDEFVIDTDRPTRHVAHDGERSRIPSPLRLTVRRDALRVLVPASEGPV